MSENALTPDAFLAAGWKEYRDRFKPPESRSFQCRVRDAIGTMYFVDATWYPPAPYRPDDCVEIELGYDGTTWTSSAVRVLLYAIRPGTTIADVMRWADEVWTRLTPNYYERNDE